MTADTSRDVRRAAVARPPDQGVERAERLGRLLLSLLLAATILVILIPAILFGHSGRIVLLKLGVAAILSALPGWLYVQFIKNKGQSLYDEYVINLFRLHIDEYRNLPAPPQHTSYYKPWKEEHDKLECRTKDNLYRKKFETVYGRSSVSTLPLISDRSYARDRTETFAPVVLATALLCLGWVLVLQPELLRDAGFLSGVEMSGRPRFAAEALRFGFIGAYAFILQDLVRRYFRDDLKTAAYISASVRVVFVRVIVTAAHVLWPERSGTEEQIFAFFIGFFPQIGLQAMQAALAKPLGRLVPSMRSEYPLSELEGLNVWYEARLAEEGIEDVQNLASANLVDLVLRTRVPIARLVDWLDQAFLYLYLSTPKAPGGPSPRACLRQLGIRTATDFERVWALFEDDPAGRSVVARCLAADDGDGTAAARALLESLKGEVNLWHVRQFRAHKWLLRDEERRHGRVGETNGHPSAGAQAEELVTTG